MTNLKLIAHHMISTNQRRARGIQLQELRESEFMSFVPRDPARSREQGSTDRQRKMPKKNQKTSDWVKRQNFRTPKTLKLRPVQHIMRTAEANKKRRARLELSEENLETSGEDDVTFSQDRENEPSPPHRRSFTGDISLDSNQNRNEVIITNTTKIRNMKRSNVPIFGIPSVIP